MAQEPCLSGGAGHSRYPQKGRLLRDRLLALSLIWHVRVAQTRLKLAAPPSTAVPGVRRPAIKSNHVKEKGTLSRPDEPAAGVRATEASERRHSPGAGLAVACGLLLLLLAAGCAVTPEPAAGGPGRAGLVVVLPDGSQRRACVRFSAAQITGEELLKRSGLPYVEDQTNPMGSLVCSIDGQGCDFPARPCFCKCQALRSCQYWAYFVQDEAGNWVYATLGARAQPVRDGDVDAWVWLSSTSAAAPGSPPLPKITLAEICSP